MKATTAQSVSIKSSGMARPVLGAILLVMGATLAVFPAAAQTPDQQTTTTSPRIHHKKSTPKPRPAIPEPAPEVPAPPVAPPNMLDQPAVPATVTARHNVLSVKADNSSLTQILHQVSNATGMQLDGLGSDERVFGSFGPGAPREVLTALLNGTAYNIMMVGNLPNGAPRELLLTRRDGTDSKAPTASPTRAPGDEDTSTDDTGTTDDPDEPVTPPPPMQNAPQGQPIPPGVRTPQSWQQLQQQRNLPTTPPPQ